MGTPCSTDTCALAMSASAFAASNAGLQHERRARRHRPHHHAEAEDREERHRGQHAIVGRELDAPRRCARHSRPSRDARAARPSACPSSPRCTPPRGPARRPALASEARGRPEPLDTQIFQLEDPVVVPQVLVAHRDDVLQVGQVAQQVFEALQVIDATPALDRHDRAGFGMPQLVAQVVTAELRTDRHHHRAQLGARRAARRSTRSRWAG